MIADLELAHDLADAADAISRPFIDADILGVTTKADGSPVTAVDRQVEEALGAIVSRERPADGFLGEEVGEGRTGDRRWIVDGIDGTAQFVAHRPEWSTLIALEVHGRLEIGVASAPALGRRWWASRGHGAWTAAIDGDGVGDAVPVRVSGQTDLEDAAVAIWPALDALRGSQRDAAERLTRFARVKAGPPLGSPGQRRPPWGSGYPNGGLLVASGQLDAIVLFGGGPWDHAALAVIVEAAGGRFSDLEGTPRIASGVAVYTNGRLHESLLATVEG